MKILIHHFCVFEELSCYPGLSFFHADIFNILTLNTYLLIKSTELHQLIKGLSTDIN